MQRVRKRRFRMHRSVVTLLICAVLAAACSVSTPRNGFTRVGAGAGTGSRTAGAGGTTGTGITSDLGGADTNTSPGGTAVTAAGQTSGPSASSGGGGGGGGGGSPAPAGGLAAGVTSQTVTVSAIAGFSGNYGAIITKIFENGFLVWAEDVNANGGIHGRQIVVKKVDNKDTAEGGVAACKQIEENGSALAVSIVGFGGADVAAVDCLNRAGITTLAFNLSSFSPTWTTVYSAGDADKQTRPMASFIKNVLGETDKVGIIWVRDPLDDALRGALADELPKEGLRVVREEGVASGQGSFVAELNRLRDAGATSVALFVSMTEVLGILRDAKALGYAPNWTGSYWPSDETTAAGSALFQGIKVIRSYATTNSEAYATYHAKAEKYGRRDVVNSTTMSLYGMGLIVGAVIDNAGDQPATGSFGPAIEQLVNYDNQTFLTLNFGPGVHIAEVGMYPAECCNDDSTWRGIGPARTRF